MRLGIPAALLPLALAGCLGSGTPQEKPVVHGAGVREDARMTQADLDQLCLAFGERYLIAVGNACNQVERASEDPTKGARAHGFKLQTASSVYDILTGPNPFAKLMDLILLAELEHRVWVVDGTATRTFGAEAARPLTQALERGRDDVWAVADQVVKPEQRTVFEEMIQEWRRKNPAAESIAFVRFSDFSEYRGKSILDGVPQGSGLLQPVSEAMRQLEETRMLAERGMFLTKRMPLLMRWHAESFLNTALLNPQIRKMEESVAKVAAAAETLPAKISEERAIILKTMEERERSISAIAKDVRATASDVKDIVKDAHVLLQETEAALKAADALTTKLAPSKDAKDAHAFDIREYSGTIRDGTKAVQEMRALLESGTWTTRLKEVNQSAQARFTDAGEEARRVIDMAFWRGAILIGLIFALSLTYRIVSQRLAAPKS